MGPPEFTGGNYGTARIPAGHLLRFNGAAGIHRRKLLRKRYHLGGGPASMGPPEFTGGNTRLTWKYVLLRRKLQWGRRNSPAETLAEAVQANEDRLHASMGPPEFTGGNTRRCGSKGCDAVASMGPPEFTGGNLGPSPLPGCRR